MYQIPQPNIIANVTVQPPEVSVASLSSVTVVLFQVAVYSYYDAKVLPYFASTKSDDIFFKILIMARVSWLALIVGIATAKIPKSISPFMYSPLIRKLSVVNFLLSIALSLLVLMGIDFNSVERGGECSEDLTCLQARCCAKSQPIPLILIPAVGQIGLACLFNFIQWMLHPSDLSNAKNVTEIEESLFGCSLTTVSEGKVHSQYAVKSLKTQDIIAAGFSFISPNRLVRTKDVLLYQICGYSSGFLKSVLNVSAIEWEVESAGMKVGKVRDMRRLMAFAMDPIVDESVNLPANFVYSG